MSNYSSLISRLIHRFEQAANALMRGNITTYLELVKHADDYTLMQPFGGAPSRGFEDNAERRAQLSRFFRGGEAKLELVDAHVSGDLVVLVLIERQHGEVGGLPDQDWSLRVTLVLRRSGTEWLLLHRHADPLVHGIALEQASVLARG